MIFWHLPPFLGKAASCVLSSFHAAAYCLQEQWQKKSIFLPQTRSGCCMCAFQLPCCCIPSSGAVVSNSPPSGQYRTCALFQSMPFITRPVPDTVSPQAFKLSVLGAFWFFISSAQHIHTHTHTHRHTHIQCRYSHQCLNGGPQNVFIYSRLCPFHKLNGGPPKCV